MASVTGMKRSSSSPTGPRTFLVRPEDADQIDLGHVKLDAGFSDLQFRISYESSEVTNP